MRLATINEADRETAVAVDPGRGVVPVRDLMDIDGRDAMAVLATTTPAELDRLVLAAPDSHFRSRDEVRFVAPYRHPRKIWGIGLNYVAHAADLTESVPDEPASFIKGDHTIIGPGDDIPLPAQSERVTAEAELGLIIGRYCRDVSPQDALDYVWGVCPVLDQTAEDILARNPRFLTRAKNFPGFFAFGPEIVPMSEVLAAGALADVEVATVHNGEVHRSNAVRNMRYDPAYLVSFHSKVMPLFPGDIISPGTPGAVHVRAGDVVECRIPGIGVLRNPVATGS
jgi:2-keto-4-pentenoate hydratase/2-oxohepta-3-ene-1,7-dioic acid hydratase in catechol pathway